MNEQLESEIRKRIDISQERAEVSVNTWQPPVFKRPILATQDTYDQNTQVDHTNDAFAIGQRPLWNVPNQSVVNERVSTIKSSAAVGTITPSLATQGGVLSSPNTALTSFRVVPNLAQSFRATGPVFVNFSVNVQTVNANDPVSFAIFRNGQQVSQVFLSSGGAANTPFSALGYFTDNPPLGTVVYDVRWKANASTLTAVGTQRTIQVLNLRAQ